MASGITLSAGVRQNLLSLQSTAALSGATQNRLATGKKVNSALDNPTNFFTSQALSARASDLNSLLDNIGQATKTIEAADKGITSLSKLVESAKSVAKQARQSAGPSAVTYGQVNVAATSQAETLGTTGNGSAITVANSQTYSFDLNVNGTGAQTATYTSDATATLSEIQAGLGASLATALSTAGVAAGSVTLSAKAAADGIMLDAGNPDVDFTIANNTGAGLTNGTYNSTSLLDRVVAAGGVSGSSTLKVAVNGGSDQSITFGTGAGQVSTIAELNTALGGLSGVTASASGTAVSFSVASGTTQNSLKLTGSTGVTTALGVTNATTNGVASTSSPNANRTSLQTDYNDILKQIDQLAKDTSYNGINLLAGDDLKVVFNETGSSSLTISGVDFDSSGLGLSQVTGTAFQDDANVDSTIASLDNALSTLRTQGSKFGSNLSTVQTRQDFTKSLINTLQTGGDSLVLADTNEEGANLLSLQTRQQLSSTALSLSAQADQAVLRLF